MINGVRVKVCGITSLVDAEAAAGTGADFLGFIFYPKSPRWVSAPQYRAMQDRLPARAKVAVSVEPTPEDLAQQLEHGFDFFQIHFNPQTPVEVIRGWAETVGSSRLWLAPRLPPGVGIYPELLPFAGTFLIDTFHPDKMGGTGTTGDWDRFKCYQNGHPEKHWILSGGLDAANVAEAVALTGAKLVDVNSGVEQAPGIKSPRKLQQFASALQQVARPDPAS